MVAEAEVAEVPREIIVNLVEDLEDHLILHVWGTALADARLTVAAAMACPLPNFRQTFCKQKFREASTPSPF